MNLHNLKYRWHLAVLTAVLLGTTACDSCSPKETPPPVEPPKVETKVEEPVDPLKEAREAAEKEAESVGVVTNDTATLVASAIEAEANKPKAPTVSRPKEEAETGAIDKVAVKRVFDANNVAMRKCYERVLKANPGIEGKVTLEVKIRGDGTVASASARGTSLNNSAINDCMERQAMSMKFPAPKGGAVRVANPYTFRPEF